MSPDASGESVYTRKGIEGSPDASGHSPQMPEEKFFVYILQSMKDFSFYIGQCNDLDSRMSKHFDGME